MALGSLGDYYAERGESPGVWLGSGLAPLEGGPRPGDPVAEAQMVALFGHGHHPTTHVSHEATEGAAGVTALGTPLSPPAPGRRWPATT